MEHPFLEQARLYHSPPANQSAEWSARQWGWHVNQKTEDYHTRLARPIICCIYWLRTYRAVFYVYLDQAWTALDNYDSDFILKCLTLHDLKTINQLYYSTYHCTTYHKS